MPIVGRGRITPGTGEITYADETGEPGFATAIVNGGSSSESGIVRSVSGNNLGVGFGVFAGTNGSRDIVLDFKSLVAGDGLTLSEDGSTITINQIGAPGTIRFSSLLEAPPAIITNGILFGATPGKLDFIDPPDEVGSRLTWTEDGFAWLPETTGTVSSVGVTGRDGVVVTGSTITTSGVFTVGLEPTGVMAASYTAPTVTIDAFGRVTAAVSNTLGDLSKAANIGTGAGLYAGKVNGDLTFRSLRATGTATVSTVGDEIVIGSSGGVTSVAATGENGVSVSGGPITGDGTFTVRLTDTGVVPGTYASANVTVNAQGRVVYIEDGEPGVTSVAIVGTNGISATGGPITSSGTIALALTDTGVAANTYTAPTLTIDATGRITAATTNAIITDAATLGSSGANIGGVVAGKTGSTLNLRRIVAVGGLSLTETATDIILDASGLGGSGSGSSLNILDNGSLAGADIANLNFDGFNVHVTGNTATVSLDLPSGTVTRVEAVGTNGVTVSGSPITEQGTLTIGLSNTGVTANSYTHPNLTVDAQGRITAIASVTPSAVGTGQSVVANPATLAFKSIKGGTGVTVSATANEIVIDASASGTVTSVNALGNNGITVSGGPITGSGTLTLGLSNTGVTATTYTFPSITVDAQGRITSATGVTPTNLGTGQPVLASPSALSFKTIKAGTNVTLDATTNDITINAAGGGTVTSVNATGSGGITVSGGPITGSGSLAIALGASGVTAASYTAPTITVDAQGRITSASSNSIVTAGANLGTTTTNAGLVFSSVTGATANFRRIVGSGGLTVTQTVSDIILDTSALAVADAIRNGISLGDGDEVFAGVSGSTLQFKSLVAGSGVTLASTADEITITADAMTAMPGLTAGQYTSPTLTVDEYGRITAIINGASAVTGGANVGTGTASVYKDTNGNTLRFKTLKQGSGVTLTDNGNDITIASDALATIPGVQGTDYTAPTISVDQYGRITAITDGQEPEFLTFSNTGGGAAIFKSKLDGAVSLRTLVEGSNVTITESSDTITIGLDASLSQRVTSVGMSSTDGDLVFSGQPITSSGVIDVNLAPVPDLVPGTYAYAQVTVNEKGIITAIVEGSATGTVTGVTLTGTNGITITGDSTITTNGTAIIGLVDSGVTAGEYTNPRLFVNAQGMITQAASTPVVNLGNIGAGVHNPTDDSQIGLRRIASGDGISVVETDDQIVLSVIGVPLTIMEDGAEVADSPSQINFTGNVAVSGTAGAVTVAVQGAPVQKNGVSVVANPSAINFTGGVTVTNNAGVATVDVQSSAPTNLGTGTALYSVANSGFKSLKAGANVSITEANNEITIAATGGGGSGGGGTEYVVFQYTSGSSGTFNAADFLVSKTDNVSVNVTDPANCIVEFTFANYPFPPAAVSVMGQNFATNEFNYTNVSPSITGARKIAGGGTAANPTLMGAFTKMTLQISQSFTGASAGLGQRAKAIVMFKF